MKFTAEDFVAELFPAEGNVTIVADTALSPVDEAFEHAKAHWWMGWTWEEISSTLEDMGYVQKVINNAISRTQTFARDVLNDGPFSMYKEGQLIKLTTGFIGQLADAFREHVNIIDLHDQSVVSVRVEQIDRSSSMKLKEAYLLRLGAYKIVKAAPTDETPGGVQKIIPKSPIMPGPPQSQMQVQPQLLEKLDVKVTEKAPSGWGDLTPQFSEVEEVSALAATVLSQIDAAEKELATVESELQELNSMAKDYRGRQKDLKKQEAELAKQLFSVVGSENEAINDLEVTFFQKYKNKIVGLQRTIHNLPQEPGVLDELVALKEILENNAPEIAKQVLDILDTWKQENTTIVERIHETFAMYPPPKKKSGQLLDKALAWFTRSWEKVKAATSSMYFSLFPKIDSVSEQIDAATARLESSSREVNLGAALKHYGLE